MDGSTDSGNNENELFMIFNCDVSAKDKKVHTSWHHMDYLSYKNRVLLLVSCCLWSARVTTQALLSIGISTLDAEHCSKLANIAKEGLKRSSQTVATVDLLDVVSGAPSGTGC